VLFYSKTSLSYPNSKPNNFEIFLKFLRYAVLELFVEKQAIWTYFSVYSGDTR